MATASTTVLQAVPVTIPMMRRQRVELRLIGDSPLISHAWSQKAKQMMLDKQTKKPREKKDAKDPEQDFRESMYYLPDGRPGFPAVAFKSAAVGACRFVDTMKMTEARGSFHIIGDLIAIEGDPEPREDMVRVGMGTADIRYRAQFRQWAVTLHIEYNASVITPETIVHLFDTAGFAVGVGDWRPERDGSFGMFHVAKGEE